MKGVPEMPRCGFSRQVVQVLDFYSKPLLILFKHFIRRYQL